MRREKGERGARRVPPRKYVPVGKRWLCPLVVQRTKSCQEHHLAEDDRREFERRATIGSGTDVWGATRRQGAGESEHGTRRRRLNGSACLFA